MSQVSLFRLPYRVDSGARVLNVYEKRKAFWLMKKCEASDRQIQLWDNLSASIYASIKPFSSFSFFIDGTTRVLMQLLTTRSPLRG